MDKTTKIIISVSCTLALIVGGFFLYITWQHNPQCEFHCEGIINWANWLPYGLIYGAIAFIASTALGFGFKYGYGFIKRAT